MINGFVNMIFCLFVVLDVNNKISFPFLSFRAPPSLLRPNDSLIYPSRVCTVGNRFLPLWRMFVQKIKKGRIKQVNKIIKVDGMVCH